MKRNLQTQSKFFYCLNAFSPFHKTFTLHDLGPGHPGTLVIKRNEVRIPLETMSCPTIDHHHYMEMTAHQLSYTEKSNTDNFSLQIL